MSVKQSKRGIKRLEVTMRDVMDGLEDAASYMNYHSTPDIVEILSIEPADHMRSVARSSVIPFSDICESNIVEYIIQRELKRSA